MDTFHNHQSEEQEQLEQLKDDFLSSISHELRSPLTNIKMATQMLRVLLHQDEQKGITMLDRLDSELKPEPTNNSRLNRVHAAQNESSLKTRAVRYIQILERECDQEINLINNFLDLQQLDAGMYGFSAAIIHLQDWLPEVIKPFLARIDKQQQQLQVDDVQQLPDLTTDPLSLERVLSELLTNACKFTPPGGTIAITARLSQSPVAEGAQRLQLNVTNSKVEIPASELPRIFERFYRSSGHDRWKHGGTGLGLALAKKLVDHLGGLIWVESSNGKTCFTVEIPIDR